MIKVHAEEETDNPEPVPSDQAAEQNNQTAPADAADEIPTDLSKEEMLKNAKARKKVAKNNFNFKKGM